MSEASSPKPSLGRIVHYRLSRTDVEAIVTSPGYDSRRCNMPRAEQYYPAVVVAATPGDRACNLRVLLDGTVDYWATSRSEGDAGGQWIWPPRV